MKPNASHPAMNMKPPIGANWPSEIYRHDRNYVYVKKGETVIFDSAD